MGKSDENKIKKSGTLPANLDYSRLPKDVLDAITHTQYKIEKKVKLSFDGRQFVIRIPKEIVAELGITKDHYILFSITKKFGATKKPDLKMELTK
ncbi:MAG: hypothetical protein M1382_02220 [Candidatus Marsarchaeota archaeon]|nr:hypothetical protein [Candidatus Marsarchaeota archaeon]